VLGMHRSGTSALTGSLNVLGCEAPAVRIKKSAQNPKGFFEATSIARLNDALLDSAGQTWDSWHPMPSDWMDTPQVETLIPAAQELLAKEFGTPSILALKDPRICRLLPFWRQVLEQQSIQPLILHIHRHPMEVAQSLQKRNGFDLSKGLLLWLTYVLSSERASRGSVRSFISFPQLLEGPVIQMKRVLADLGARVPHDPVLLEPKTSDFISPALRHHTIQNPNAMPALHQSVFDILNRWALEGETDEDHARLDQAWRLFSTLGNTIAAAPDLDANSSDLIYQAMYQITPDQPVPLPSLPRSSGTRVAQIMGALTTSLNQELKFAETQHLQAQGEATARVQALEDTIQTQDLKNQRNVDALRRDLSHQGETITRLNNTTEALGRDIRTLSQEKTTLEDTVRNMHADKITAEQTWAATERARRALERQLSALKQEQAELNQLTRYIDAERQAILSSTSWRLTRPLRWLAKRLRRGGQSGSSNIS